MNFTFNSRTSYLKYRLEWKAAYAQATIRTRFAKQKLREASRAFAIAHSSYNWRVNKPDSEEFKNFYAAWDVLSKAEANRGECRVTARELLEELAEAKKEAERQWKAQCTASRI